MVILVTLYHLIRPTIPTKETNPLHCFDFCGFNHHISMVIFGVALLYDETAESFKWLFETFLKAHQGKKPRTIFTDQDALMVKPLREVLLDMVHGLCTWHLLQNCLKHLSHLRQGEMSTVNAFSKCMYDYVDELQLKVA